MTAILPYILPCAAFVATLVVLWRLWSDLRPIFVAIIGGVGAHAQRNAPLYGYALLLAVSASLQEIVAVADENSWDYVKAAAKVAQPGLLAIIGLISRNAISTGGTPNGGTAAPFPKPNPSP